MARSIAAQLADYLAAAPAFSWAASNCVHMAAGWLLARGWQAAWPADLAVRGPLHARRQLRALGHASLQDAVTQALQRQPVPAAMAQVGDLVLVVRGCCQALGICAGRTVAVLGPAGVAHVQAPARAPCWRVAGGAS